jgi:Tfp pilus assembly protein PilO
MIRFPKRKVMFVFEVVAVGVVLLNLAMYLIAVKPLSTLAQSEWQKMTDTRRKALKMESRVADLESYHEELPETVKAIETFQHDHVPPKRRGYAKAMRMVRNISEQSGVELFNVAFRTENEKKEPMKRLGIVVDIQGAYPNLLKFAHSLETSDQVVLLRDFSFYPNQGGLGLRLNAEMYLTP